MKDPTHHLKHVQKKIVQAARKETIKENGKAFESEEYATPLGEKVEEEKRLSAKRRKVRTHPLGSFVH